MGGSGSGTWYRYSAKDTTSDYKAIDVNYLNRRGYLRPGWSFPLYWSRGGKPYGNISVRSEEGRIVLVYRLRSQGGEWEDLEYAVRLTWTPCNFGGRRPWFVCPNTRCGRRVGKLYGGRLFLCRHCHRLAYQSQNQPTWDRILTKAQDIRSKLGGSMSMGDLFPEKPRGMHWRTYDRLEEEYRRLEERLDYLTASRFLRLPLPDC